MKTETNNLSQVEDSKELRLACLAMTILSVSLALYYIDAPIFIVAICTTTIFVGSYLSYQYRAKKNLWLASIAIFVTLIIMANFAYEVFFQCRLGRLNLLIPFIGALAQLQSLHSIDLRTRSDTNTSLMIGLALLGCTAILGQDLLFALSLLIYGCLAAFFLYRQSVAFTLDFANNPEAVRKTISLSQTSPPSLKQPRTSVGSTLFTIASLPVCALLFSLIIPHIESSIDQLTTALFKTMVPQSFKVGGASNVASLSKRRMPSSEQRSPRKAEEHRPGDKGKSAGGSKSSPEIKSSNTSAEGRPGDPGKNGKGLSTNKKLAAASNPAKPDKSKLNPNTAHRQSADGRGKEEALSLRSEGKKKFAEDNKLFLTIKSSRALFLKRLTFDHFDGTNWYLEDQPSNKTFETNPEYCTSIVSGEISKAEESSIGINQEITAKAELGHYIPAAWRPMQIALSADKISIDQAGNLQTKTLLIPGFTYRVISNLPVYNLADLRSHLDDYAALLIARQLYQDDLNLPDKLKESAASLAQKIVGKESRWFVQAELICKYLRNNFKYSLTCQDKEGTSPINDFLFVSKTGDCTRFASAFAVLCRSLKIPTRCVSGFTPGTPNLSSGAIEIRAAQSHAWAEIFLPESGWVPFDAVPGGYLPDSKPTDTLLGQMAKSEFDKQMLNLESLTTRLSEKISLNPFFNHLHSKLDAANPVVLRLQRHLALGLAIAGLGVLLLYLVGKTYLVAQERRKLRASSLVFLEVMNSLGKIQIKRSTADTPQEIMDKVHSRLEEISKPKWREDLPELLTSFLDSYCLNRFNASDSPKLTAELKEKSSQIKKLLASAR